MFFHLKIYIYFLAYGHFKSTLALASHADVLRGSSRVPAPLTSADLSGKKTKTNHSRLPDLGSALWTLRNFALDFIAPEKIRKVS